MDLLPFDDYVRSLNRKRMSAGVLLRDGDRRVLLIQPSYKPHWDIPGGAVDAEEAPWTTAVRELREELGIVRTLGPPLVIDHIRSDPRMPEGIAFIFDGGLIDQADVDALDLTDPEILSVDLVPVDQVATKVKPSLARRLSVAWSVVATGNLALCNDGERITL
ncbi:NUDIX domain-containing protein [Haloechinothrix alba]|uniref:NUDIX domain-containing protein n=1 Tax=Haloechinothrix alba TaxID=664784 RepID=UPI000B77ADB2|nr:NUDIX hydrolase [Haloechinothrix alba]